MSEDEITIEQAAARLRKLLADTGAASFLVVNRDADGRGLAATIVVRGIPETDEIVEAVEAVQDSWDAEDDS